MKTPVTYPLKNTAPPGVKYYLSISYGISMYYAVHKDGRIQVTSIDGAWLPTDYLPSDATRCKRRVAVDCNGNHETWD